MYTIYIDGLPFHGEGNVCLEPELTQSANSADELTFEIPINHPYYDKYVKLQSQVIAYKDKTPIFYGRVLDDSEPLEGLKKLTCESELAYLNDSIQPPARYQNMTVRSYLEALIKNHNEQIKVSNGLDKTFEIGITTVKEDADTVYRYTNWENTLTSINDDLIENYGGYLRVRHDGTHRYIDYLADCPKTASQELKFGMNILDFVKTADASELATAIIPIGARIEQEDEEQPVPGLEEYLTISDVNNGSNYVYDADEVAKRGLIYKTAKFDQVTIAENLLSKGKKALEEAKYESVKIELSAIDLSMLNADYEAIDLLDDVLVSSPIHALSGRMPVIKKVVKFDNPAESKITVGKEEKAYTDIQNIKESEFKSSIRSLSQSLTSSIVSVHELIEDARKEASDALNAGGTNGIMAYGKNELLITDTGNIETAKKVFKLNLNGLGYGTDGYAGTYETVITSEGLIVGDRIVSGSITTEKINAESLKNFETTLSSEILGSVSEELSSNYYTSGQVDQLFSVDNASLVSAINVTANAYVDDSLKNYYLKSEINQSISEITAKIESVESENGQKIKDLESKITQTADSLSSYVKTSTYDALEKRVSIAESNITQTSSSLSSYVKTSDFGTEIEQNSSSVRISWNKLSSYIQFESSKLNIYDSAATDRAPIMSLGSAGMHFHKTGSDLGWIGSTSMVNDSSYRGLAFNLDNSGNFMSWAYKLSSTANVYTVMMAWYGKNYTDNGTTYLAGTLYYWTNVVMRSGYNYYQQYGSTLYHGCNVTNSNSLDKMRIYSADNARYIDVYIVGGLVCAA